MAQFDVHRNTGRHRDDIPYVVLVQSSLYDITGGGWLSPWSAKRLSGR